MITLRQHLLPAVLADLLLSTQTCTFDTAASTPSGVTSRTAGPSPEK